MKPPFTYDGSWPVAGAQSVEFIAILPTAGLHIQRLLWSRLIEEPHDRVSLEQSPSGQLVRRKDMRDKAEICNGLFQPRDVLRRPRNS